MDQLIILRKNGGAALSVAASDEASAISDALCAACDAVDDVNDEESQRAAVAIQARCNDFLKAIERDRKRAKEGPMELCRSIDAVAKELSEGLKDSVTGLSRHIGDYQALLRAKGAAEEQKRLADLARIESEKAEAIAKAEKLEDVDNIREKFDALAAQSTPAAPPPQERNQVVRVDWEVTVTDIWMLARAHPACVKIEPRMSEIKALLNAGVKVAGVSAERVTTSTTRSTSAVVNV